MLCAYGINSQSGPLPMNSQLPKNSERLSATDTHALLTAQRQTFLARIAELEHTTRHRDEPLPADSSEQATAIEDLEVQEALEAETRAGLQQVNLAISRLDQGAYGVCEHCGAAITPARLHAMPAATRCIQCAA